MKRIIISLGWLMLLVPFISVAGARTIYGNIYAPGADTETRQVSGFSGISSGGSYKVLVTLGDKESLKMEGDSDDLDQIETVVEDGTLKIRSKKSFGISWSSEKVTIYITAKSLNKLSVSGSGDMTSTGILKTSELSTVVSGSGSIRVTANVSELSAAVSGSGSVTISGSATSCSISISGSGGFNGKDLKTADAGIRISGSGNAYIIADKTLDARLSGSGTIRYSGSAEVNVKKSGSGRVVKI